MNGFYAQFYKDTMGKSKILLLLSFIPILGFAIYLYISLPYRQFISNNEFTEGLETLFAGQVIVLIIFYCFSLLF